MSENLVRGEGVAGPKMGTEIDQVWVEATAHCWLLSGRYGSMGWTIQLQQGQRRQ